MNCSTCDKDIVFDTWAYLYMPDEGDFVFCSRDCLRAWLGPDRPTSASPGTTAIAGKSPQDVVSQLLKDHWSKGESALGCPECAELIEEFAKAQLR